MSEKENIETMKILSFTFSALTVFIIHFGAETVKIHSHLPPFPWVHTGW